MVLREMRRLATLVVLAAVVSSPAFPVGGACLSACRRASSRAAHACCRPSHPAAPLTVRAPGCCRPSSEKPPTHVVKAVEPVAKAGAALAALPGSVTPAAASPRATILTFATNESPPPLPPFRAVLRI